MTTNDVPSKWCQGGETTHPEEPGGETTHPEEPGGSDESVLRIFFSFAKKFSDIESDIQYVFVKTQNCPLSIRDITDIVT